MASPWSMMNSKRTLRTSSSLANIGIGGSASAQRGSHRRTDSKQHRRKGSESSLAMQFLSSYSQGATAEKLSTDTQIPSAWSNDASGSGGHGNDAGSSMGGGGAGGGTSKKAKRRSYFECYPERNSPRLRDDSAATTLAAKAAAAAARALDEEEGSDSMGRSTIRAGASGVEKDSSVLDIDYEDRSNTNIAFPSMPRQRYQPSRDSSRPSSTASSEFRSVSAGKERKSKQSYSSHSSSSRRTHHTHTPHSLVPHDQDDLPGLRFSYSSSTQTQAETPPQTPVDRSSNSLDVGFNDIRVVVAAPIAGVEAMDALVDGMDGSDDDDLYKKLSFLSQGLGSSAPKKPSKAPAVKNHHPLYAPPLPTPPPGIKLGGALPRTSPSSDDEDDESFINRSGKGPYSSQPRRKPSSQAISNYHSPSGKRGDGGQDSRRLSISSTTTSMLSNDLEDTTPTAVNPSIDEIIRKHTSLSSEEKEKAVVPSISEIIRKNSSALAQISDRPGSRSGSAPSSSVGHSTARVHSPIEESEPEPLSKQEEAEILARSSMDSVEAEVQESLRNLKTKDSTLTERPIYRAPGSSSSNTSSSAHRRDYGSVRDSRDFTSEPSHSRYSYRPSGARSAGAGGGCNSSIRSGSSGVPPSPFSDPEFHHLSAPAKKGQDGQKEMIANYLRSTRITTLLKLTRRPHASPENSLTVSVSDLGNPNGYPLVVFLGLGCVRYVMGLYDEMAECLGLRLITIDRWGIGRTGTPHPSATRGVAEWATVVEEVLDRLNVDCCSVMAHSAGAPYALSFANKYPDRIVGDVCLLAPWVMGGGGNGYKWLKYVPNGLLKTAQAAEWKIQAWMIGKPPKITYEGIGYNVRAPLSSADFNKKGSSSGQNERFGRLLRSRSEAYPEPEDDWDDAFPGDVKNRVTSDTTPYNYNRAPPRSSATFSDYDDLEDFGGRFESRSTLPRQRKDSNAVSVNSQNGRNLPMGRMGNKKKPSKGFLRLWKNTSNTESPKSPSSSSNGHQDQNSKQTSVASKKLRTLKSIGSLRTKPSTVTVKERPKTSGKSPVLPEHTFDTGIRLEDLPHVSGTASPDLTASLTRRGSSTYSVDSPLSSATPTGLNRRAGGRRSISFTATTGSYTVVPSPPPSAFPGGARFLSASKKPGESYQVALGNALIAASHAESSKGTHTDLLQILNHDQRPWGFSYARYPHKVRVWYGDKDERIAENAVRWMEENMGSGRCTVKVVKGADHGLMYRSNVVVDVLEQIRGYWRDGERNSSTNFHVKRWTDGSSVYLYSDDK
ncbi:alpha/beta-hydrolase [Schizopora paradoxa]|uniref:Alpha/beta-hydrolase n=1 Tax=Schizopora paradoxa TaxID=27342 RepID=A0A0H2RL04_9AGAM|nr:alpha/beta-hydrolase [Schizopora paradoxa]